MLLLSLILHTFNLHFALPTPALLKSPTSIMPQLTLYRLLITRVLRPAFWFCLPVILASCVLLSTSLSDINLIVRAPLGVLNFAPAPEETRVTSLTILGIAVAMLFYLIHGVASIFPTVITNRQSGDPHTPASPWDAYGREVGIVARRAHITALLQYSEPYWFPPTVRIVMRVFVAPPVTIIRLLGKRDMALRVRDGVQALLWRAMIAPAGVVLAVLFSWKQWFRR